jgi:nitrate/nitrite-specific signal transduction histidine kinase
METLTNTNHKHKRYVKNYLINPRFQLKYVFWMISTGAALALTYSMLFYNYAKQSYDLIIELSKVPKETQLMMHQELGRVMLVQGLITFVFLFCIGMIGILFSHRVAGPLYKLKTAFERVKMGEHQLRIYFRKYDEFQEVAQSFNKMLDQIQGSDVKTNQPTSNTKS